VGRRVCAVRVNSVACVCDMCVCCGGGTLRYNARHTHTHTHIHIERSMAMVRLMKLRLCCSHSLLAIDCDDNDSSTDPRKIEQVCGVCVWCGVGGVVCVVYHVTSVCMGVCACVCVCVCVRLCRWRTTSCVKT